ncbi:MAG: hypothetical protein QM715_18630 [Nibricoccus sp.]
MQETEQIATRTDGPANNGGIMNLFTTAVQTAGQVYGAISTQNNANKVASAQADATRAAAQTPVISPTPVAAQASTVVAGAPASTWIKGVSNTVVIVGGVVLVVVLGLFFFRRK